MNQYYFKTNNFVTLTFLCLSIIFISSCDSNSNDIDDPESILTVNTVENLFAPGTRTDPTAGFVFFSLKSGTEIAPEDSASNSWDIAFQGTNILVNSGISGPGNAGAVLLDVPFEDVEIAPTTGYSVDNAESFAITGDGGWYTYTGTTGSPQHAVITRDGITILLKTGDGEHYAKLEILSYYQDSPDYNTEAFANLQTRPASQYFTFRYAIQQTEGLRELK